MRFGRDTEKRWLVIVSAMPEAGHELHDGVSWRCRGVVRLVEDVHFRVIEEAEVVNFASSATASNL